MSLVSFCDADTCWLRRICYRWAQERRAGNDGSTHIVVKPPPVNVANCPYYVAVMPGDKLRPEAGK